MSGAVVLEEKWPVLGRHELAAGWLQVWTDLGRAPRTIDAYARGLAEYLQVCEREDIDPLTANRADVAVFVRELTERPHRRGANVTALDSGFGLANATIQQRLVAVRLFYDHLNWKRACDNRIRSDMAVTLPADDTAGASADWYLARRSCRGFRPSGNGATSSPSRPPSRTATA